MDKKTYETPKTEIVYYEQADVLTLSMNDDNLDGWT